MDFWFGRWMEREACLLIISIGIMVSLIIMIHDAGCFLFFFLIYFCVGCFLLRILQLWNTWRGFRINMVLWVWWALKNPKESIWGFTISTSFKLFFVFFVVVGTISKQVDNKRCFLYKYLYRLNCDRPFYQILLYTTHIYAPF